MDGRKFDLVVFDMQMPNINGIDFTLLVRIHELYADLPILMVSANTDPATQNIGRNAGVSEWMGKPFTTPQLIAAVERNIHH
jgi:two-component system, chemotaxis family, chemotaxis protein CheY